MLGSSTHNLRPANERDCVWRVRKPAARRIWLRRIWSEFSVQGWHGALSVLKGLTPASPGCDGGDLECDLARARARAAPAHPCSRSYGPATGGVLVASCMNERGPSWTRARARRRGAAAHLPVVPAFFLKKKDPKPQCPDCKRVNRGTHSMHGGTHGEQTVLVRLKLLCNSPHLDGSSAGGKARSLEGNGGRFYCGGLELPFSLLLTHVGGQRRCQLHARKTGLNGSKTNFRLRPSSTY